MKSIDIGGYWRSATTSAICCGNYLDEVWTIDDRSGSITVADLNDTTGSQRHFAHGNTLYHVHGLTDEEGNLVEAYQYDAYGRPTVITDGDDGDSIVNFNSNDVRTPGGWSSVSNPYQYTGQRYDPETGLMYYKNRYYDTVFGIPHDYSPASCVYPRNTDGNTSKDQYGGYKYLPYPARITIHQLLVFSARF